MTKKLVFGHANPDTDAIVAAMAYSYLLNQTGQETEAVALGTPNEETQFALRHFDATAPRVITAAKPEVNSVILVDHNEAQQSVSDVAEVEISAIVDHHKFNLTTATPLNIRAEALGATSSILLKMFNENKVEIPANLAGLMLSAIISDTLLLKSPTTTEFDKIAVQTLAEIADVDYETYGLEMLKAGTNLATKSELDLIEGDAKSFEMGGKQVRIGQVNTVDIDEVFERQVALEEAMQAEINQNGYDLFLFVVTNILTSDSELLVVGAPVAPIEKAFGGKLDNDRLALPGVVSRKKQVVPPLTAAF
ncbi:manganese-dependent inorganic pyrophosphatase [Weissella beninensis]|uniref:Manganese-dependent inorganic pyrophosphatase n=1 Tax=Periweissella beninensis TaxID=504936 RepID=A0ABT0VGJ9_9LACO|nr:manganese-dependent inorganic pyrophosphatase [Periweissella beninensis]MBM7543833.1 manganese-dependent inorganic pyrophosphatase [Periweissella beninensis]MCM2436786.1 manganese-dependent inorganic pyrophosphatase [Periweissella beninensis]